VVLLRLEGPLAEIDKQVSCQTIEFTGHLLNENTRRGVKTALKISMLDVLTADEGWRIIAFAGRRDTCSLSSPMEKLCSFLPNGSYSPLKLFTPSNANVDAVFEVSATSIAKLVAWSSCALTSLLPISYPLATPMD
jgi:Phenol hydroxylase, C-terminal dimerisation domain